MKKQYLLFLLALSLSILTAFYFWKVDNDHTRLVQILLATSITWITLFPSLLYLLRIDKSPFPFFPLVGIYYTLSYALPVFVGDSIKMYKWKMSELTTESLVLTLIGLMLMISSFYFFRSSLFKRTAPFLVTRNPISPRQLTLSAWTFTTLYLLLAYSTQITDSLSLNQLVQPLYFMSAGLFIVKWKLEIFSKLELPIMVFVLVLDFVLKFSISGSLFKTIVSLTFIISFIYYLTRKVPWILIMLFLIFVLVFNPVKKNYRDYLKTNASSSAFKNAQTYIDLAIENAFRKDNTFVYIPAGGLPDLEEGSFIARLNYISTFSQVIEDTPSVGFWNGQTYLPLFTSFIPRVLWEEKPSLGFANAFGRRYGYLSVFDYYTAFNLPWIVEMYANFGTFGVLFGMPLVGVLFSFFDRKFNHPSIGSINLVFGASVLTRLVYQESNFALMTGGILTISMSLWILTRLFLKIFK